MDIQGTHLNSGKSGLAMVTMVAGAATGPTHMGHSTTTCATNMRLCIMS